MQELVLDDAAFDRIRAFVYEHSRIRLGENKRDLVRARLGKRLRATGLPSYASYMDHVVSGPQGEAEAVQLLDAISTNKTSFFRENEHFTYLAREVLPAIARTKGRSSRPRLRIWSAACSSGEEPYTLAMVVREHLPDVDRWDAKILATDLNTQMLAVARAGQYSAEVVASVPPLLRQKYCRPVRTATGERAFVVHEALRKLVVIRRLNLMESRFPFQRTFDVIFCRNVMIYFDKPTQADLVRRFGEVLDPRGYLFIGHSESLVGTTANYRYVRPTVYQRTG